MSLVTPQQEGSAPRTFAARARALPGLLEKAPTWLVVLVGFLCVRVGYELVSKPLSSLGALTFYVGASFLISGIGELLGHEKSGSGMLPKVLGWGWIAAGLVVFLWAGGTMAVLPLFLAISLIVAGIVRAVDGIKGRGRAADERISALVFALADLILGVVALSWPDVTLLVVAVLFGLRTLLFGLGQIWNALAQHFTGKAGNGQQGPSEQDSARQNSAKQNSPKRKSSKRNSAGILRRWLQVVGAVLSLLLALTATGVGVFLREGAPQLAAFYESPATVPAEAGILLKSEPFTTKVPANARAWRILYTTTRDDNSPSVASAVVLTSMEPANGPRPVITWAHGTTGYAPACAPSNLAEPFASGALPALDEIVANGWVLVATDYAGLGTEGPQPYLIGQGEARSVLDSVRAAKMLDTEQAALDMADETVVWGHSQGGQAALWTGGLAPSYAPDVKISGVVAMAPASDAVGLVANMPNMAGGSLFASYVAAAYTDTYPEVSFNDYITPVARTFVREMSTRCLSEPGVLVSLVNAISIDKDKTIFSKDPASGAMGERLRENTPVLPIPFPLFVAQGAADTLVIPSVQDAYIAARCDAGQELLYKKYADKDHMGVVAGDSPLKADLLAWTQDRIDGKTASGNCG